MSVAIIHPCHPHHPPATSHGGDADGDDDDDERRRRLWGRKPKSSHELDGDQVPNVGDGGDGGGGAGAGSTSNKKKKKKYRWKKKPEGAIEVTSPCSECGKRFWSWKALHGHLRLHPDRTWRGVTPCSGRRRPPVSVDREKASEVAEMLVRMRNAGGRPVDPASGRSRRTFTCSGCNRAFDTRQALGGHRASHKSKKGCFAIELAEEEAQEALEKSAPPPPPVRNARKPAASSTVEGGGGEAATSSSSSRRPFIDLNLPPAPTNSEEEDAPPEKIDLNTPPPPPKD